MANLIGDASRAVFGNVGKDIARKVLDLLKSGRGDEVTPQMYSAADKQFLVENYDLPTDTASRLERGREGALILIQVGITAALMKSNTWLIPVMYT